MIIQERPREIVRKFFDFDFDISKRRFWEVPAYWAAEFVGLLCVIQMNFFVGVIIGGGLAVLFTTGRRK